MKQLRCQFPSSRPAGQYEDSSTGTNGIFRRQGIAGRVPKDGTIEEKRRNFIHGSLPLRRKILARHSCGCCRLLSNKVKSFPLNIPFASKPCTWKETGMESVLRTWTATAEGRGGDEKVLVWKWHPICTSEAIRLRCIVKEDVETWEQRQKFDILYCARDCHGCSLQQLFRCICW